MIVQIGFWVEFIILIGVLVFHLQLMSTGSLTEYQVWDIITKLVAAIGTISAGLAVYWKFHEEKNRQIFERRLNEVYAPLMKLLLKQESYRAIMIPGISMEDVPIFGITETTKHVKFENMQLTVDSFKKEPGKINRTELIDTMEKSNYGLARPALLKLISEYELLLSLEDEWKEYLQPTVELQCEDKTTVAYQKYESIVSVRLATEHRLVKEIVEGYNDTVQSLGLDDKLSGLNLKQVNLELKCKVKADS